MFFIAFALNDGNDICRIREQFLNHSSELIFKTFKQAHKTLKEAQATKYNFSFIVGGSQDPYFKIVERTQKEQDEYLKELSILKANYDAYLNQLKSLLN